MNSFRTLLVGCSVASIVLSCKVEAPKTAIKIGNKTELNQILDSYVDRELYPFLYARIEDENGKVLYEHSATNPKYFKDQKINGDTWIRIWSMSKIVTITTVLDLIEDGILNLNDPVSKYIPEFKDLKVAVSKDGDSLAYNNSNNICPIQLKTNEKVMTLRHLINHEAGFYYATTNIPCLDSLLSQQNVATAKNSQDLIDRLAKLPLIQAPGDPYYYGLNTTVLGLVAERATEKTLAQLVEERVTKPMNIKGLQYQLPNNVSLLPQFSGADTTLRIAHDGELDIFGQDVPDYQVDHALYLGGEGMLATADGYTDFLRMLANYGALNEHRFLETTSIDELTSPHTQTDNAYGHNGYNIWISSDSMRIKNQGDTGLWLGGGYESTHFWVDSKRKFVGVIFSQMSFAQPEAYGLNDEFRGAVYEPLIKEDTKEMVRGKHKN